MSDNYLVFHDEMNALMTIGTLVNEGYVVMLSRELNLWVVNYLEVMNADRNDVVFMEKGEFEEKFVEVRDEVEIVEDSTESSSCTDDHDCSDCFYKFFAGFEEPCDDCKRSSGYEDNWAPFRKGCANCEYDEVDSNMYPCCECNHNYTSKNEDKWEPRR